LEFSKLFKTYAEFGKTENTKRLQNFNIFPITCHLHYSEKGLKINHRNTARDSFLNKFEFWNFKN
jgi:hypothetical protein